MKAVCGKTARTVWAADGGQRGSDVARLLRPDKGPRITGNGIDREQTEAGLVKGERDASCEGGVERCD